SLAAGTAIPLLSNRDSEIQVATPSPRQNRENSSILHLHSSISTAYRDLSTTTLWTLDIAFSIGLFYFISPSVAFSAFD
ncbi:hypothetical protein QBC44DRAFT_269653, partial [Cladorrhinum sp. PSN332]